MLFRYCCRMHGRLCVSVHGCLPVATATVTILFSKLLCKRTIRAANVMRTRSVTIITPASTLTRARPIAAKAALSLTVSFHRRLFVMGRSRYKSLYQIIKKNDYCLFLGTDAVKSDGVHVAWRVSSAAAQEERSPTSELDIDLFLNIL